MGALFACLFRFISSRNSKSGKDTPLTIKRTARHQFASTVAESLTRTHCRVARGLPCVLRFLIHVYRVRCQHLFKSKAFPFLCLDAECLLMSAGPICSPTARAQLAGRNDSDARIICFAPGNFGDCPEQVPAILVFLSSGPLLRV